MLNSNFPEAIIGEIDVVPFKIKMDIRIALDALLEGNYVIVTDFYSTGLKILKSLKEHLQQQ